jgi:hypothetical protein
MEREVCWGGVQEHVHSRVCVAPVWNSLPPPPHTLHLRILPACSSVAFERPKQSTCTFTPLPQSLPQDRRHALGHRRGGTGRTTTLRTMDLGRCALAERRPVDPATPGPCDTHLPVPVTKEVLECLEAVAVPPPRGSRGSSRGSGRGSGSKARGGCRRECECK